jgi:predicted Zn-dependent protease
MRGGRAYDIFPRTFKARVLLAAAFVGGLAVTVSGLVFFFAIGWGVGLAPWSFFDRTEITLENRTPHYVIVYVDGRKEAALEPNETEKIKDFKFLWWSDRLVEAATADGRILYSENLDEDDLEERNHRIVIEAEEFPVQEEGTPTPTEEPTPPGIYDRYPPCTGPEREGCLEAQTELVPVAQASCEGIGRRVCFAPLGQVDPELVRNGVKYYRDEYGLEIGVLTPRGVPVEMVNRDREQIDGESLATYLGTLFPADFQDPSVALIGLTPLDLYAADRDWNFQLGHANWSAQSRAVVSTYRMHLGAFRLVDDERVFSRTRKLVTKYLGLMYYDLPLSDDPKSPMYGNILRVTDLDRMEEPLTLPAEP